jgi:hypothetical protein
MKIDELPRKAVLGYLEMTRLPLTAAERALNKVEGTWAPTIAVDRFQARIKDAAASILKDDTLRADAKMQLAALDERMRAAEEAARAEAIRTQADDKLRREQKAAQAAKREVAKRDELREDAVERKAEAKKATSRKIEAAQSEALHKVEERVQRDVLTKESKALNNQRAAAEAKAEVLDLDDKIQATKAARKSS